MKLLLFGVALASALQSQEFVEPSEEGWFVPQLDGSFQWTLAEDAFKDESLLKTNTPPVVEFYLYTRSNLESPQEIFIDDESTLNESNFNASNPTRFIIHGWQNNHTSDVNTYIRKGYLEAGAFNVICVDWSKVESWNYITSVHHVPRVANRVIAMVDFLRLKGGLHLNDLTVIGHSLGAHVAGFTGKYVTGEQLLSIIGLDTARPLYSYDDCATRLCVTDAYYVESIHTSGGKLGFLEPIGRAAFYPNGGKSQPGCDDDIFGTCAHRRAYMYYAEAIRINDFLSMECSDWEKAVEKDCGSVYSNSVRLGAATNVDLANGSFYTPVNAEPPYGKGSMK